MLTVHHLGVSQSERIVWLCEELGLDYTLVRHERDPETRMAPASYKALHPFGIAPVITDGDVVLGESAAIIDYIVARHGGAHLTVAADAPNFADYLYWYHFANGTFMPAMMVGMVVRAMGAGDAPGAKSGLMARGNLAYATVEQRLGDVPWLAGDAFTVADIMTVFNLTTMRFFGGRDPAPYPNILRYLARIGARPAYRRAMEKAEPGMPLQLG